MPLSWEQTRGMESWVSTIDCRKLGAHLGGEEGWGPGVGLCWVWELGALLGAQ